MAVAPDRWGQGIGVGAAGGAAGRGRRAGAAPRCSSRSGRTTRGRSDLYRRYGFADVGMRRGYYQPSRHGRAGDAPRRPEPGGRSGTAGCGGGAGAAVHDRAAGARHRDLLRRDRRRAWSAGTSCSPTRSPPAWTSTPGSAAWCPRWPAGPTWRRWCPPWTGRWPRPGSPLARRGRDRRHGRARAWPGRCWSGCARPRRTRSRWASRSTAVNHLAAHIAVDQLGARPAARARWWRCWSRAGTPRCCWSRTWPADVVPLGRHHRRRRRRGLRQGGPAAGAAVPRRPADRRGGRRPATRPRSRSRAASTATATLRLLLLRPEDRGGPLGGGPAAGRASRCRWPTWPPRSRRRWPTC